MRRGLKRDILLLLAFIHDTYFEMTPSSIYQRVWWPDYKPKTMQQTVWRMISTQTLTKEIDKSGNVVLRIGAEGGKLLDITLPLRKLQQTRWDKRWRMVIFDIEEKSRIYRDSLRRKLKSLGFAMWQKSIYVTPHNVLDEMNDYLKTQKLFGDAVCFQAKRDGLGSDRDFAAKVFKLDELADKYLTIMHRALKITNSVNSNKIKPKKANKQCSEAWQDYTQVLLTDPFLPFELLPRSWPSIQTQKALKDLTQTLINTT